MLLFEVAKPHWMAAHEGFHTVVRVRQRGGELAPSWSRADGKSRAALPARPKVCPPTPSNKKKTADIERVTSRSQLNDLSTRLHMIGVSTSEKLKYILCPSASVNKSLLLSLPPSGQMGPALHTSADASETSLITSRNMKRSEFFLRLSV